MAYENERWYRKYVDNAWCIGYRKIKNETESIMGRGGKNVGKFELLCPSLRYWYADPMLFSKDGSNYVFMEVYDKIFEKGSIGVSKFSKKGKLLRPKIIINEKFHQSFPEIFEYEGSTYLMPESSGVNQIKLYRMKDNVYQWEEYYSFHTERKYVDPVIYISKQRVFIICTETKPDNAYKNKLYILELRNINDRTKIALIDSNIKTEDYSYSIRNGGSLFRYKGEVFRVIQEAGYKAYGRNLIFRKLIQCDENTFCESEDLLKIESKDIEYDINQILYEVRSIHTYGVKDENIEVIDLNLAEISLIGLLKRVKDVKRLLCRLWKEHCGKRGNL